MSNPTEANQTQNQIEEEHKDPRGNTRTGAESGVSNTLSRHGEA
jgi:hypothetical protein